MRKLLVKWLFKVYFKDYVYPFEKLQAKIAKMNDVKRKNYYAQARELIDMEVYKDVLQEGIRKFYQKLAVNASKEEQAQYRLTLIWITQEFDNQFKKLSMSFSDNPKRYSNYK